MDKRKLISDILKVLIVLLTIAGVLIMLFGNPEGGSGLTAKGIENLKFYTVLTNVFCGIIAFISIFIRNSKVMDVLKLAATAGVMVTFAVIAFFLAPANPGLNLYSGSNLIFHLIEPLAAALEYLISPKQKQPFVYCVYAAVPTFLYGACYLANLLINGVGGPWPDSNDFYGFLNWGYPVGMCIFAGITLVAFGISCLLRKISNSVNKEKA